ncbi:WD40 repeat-like protein [Suillus hirtellus]|nr:WD40 repeat-like protein [Suillus hirtellus]
MASSSKQPGIAVNTSVLTPVMTLEGHTQSSFSLKPKCISHISYFPGGKQMIGGSNDNIIQRWDLREGKEIKKAREVYKDLVHEVGVSRDGRWVVTAVGEKLNVCEVETGIVRTFHDGLVIRCIDLSADNTFLAGGSADRTCMIWSLDTGKLVAGPFRNSGSIMSVQLSEDSRKLAVTSWRWRTRSKQSYLEVWDIQTHKLVVVRYQCIGNFIWIRTPVLWTTKDKLITTAFTWDRDMTTIHECDVSTFETVEDSFQGHTGVIKSLALSFDRLLLASASDDNTIKLWSFGSRQLLASFDVQAPFTLILSPDSHQLAYTNRDEARIYICNIPANILTSIGLAKETSAHLTELLDSDATRHPVRRKPAISVIPSVPRPLAVTIEPRQPVILGFLRKRKLLSFRTDMARPIRTNEPRNPLDFTATAPLPHPIVNPHDDNLTTTQTAAPTSTSFKSHLHRLSTWWPLQTDHASPAIVDVPLAQGQEVLHAAKIIMMNGYLMKTMFLLLLHPIQILNSQPQQGRSGPMQENMEAASSVFAFRLTFRTCIFIGCKVYHSRHIV